MPQYVQSIVKYTNNGQACQNVYFYKTLNTTSSLVASAFNEAFENYTITLPVTSATFLEAYRAVTVAGNLYTSIDTINVLNPADFEYYPLGNLAGNIAGETASPETVMSFRSRLETRAVRRAYKRITGLPEAEINGGNLDVSSQTFQNAMNDFAVALGSTLDGVAGGVTMTFIPVIVKRISYLENGVKKYRLPETQQEWDSNTYEITLPFEIGQRTTTQYTRKRPQFYTSTI